MNPTIFPKAPENNDKFGDQQEHYKSLIDLFKFCIGLALTMFTIAGLAIGYFTNINGQQMRDDLKQQRESLNGQIKEMKSDLEKQQTQLYEREEKLENRINREVQNTKDDALVQISNTKNIATNQARERIDEVFRDKNFDAFVEKVAKERMEPQIQKMVDDKLAKIDSIEINKIIGLGV